MTIRDVIDKLLAYHPDVPKEGSCDGVKCGDIDVECTGIATAICASVDIIRKAAAAGCNFLLVHEPTFYTHFDPLEWLEGKNEVFEKKMRLINENGMVIFRDHDRLHRHIPDGINNGVMEELGWTKYLTGSWEKPKRFVLPETTAREVALHIKNTLGMKAVRIIGNPDAKVSKVGFVGHIGANTTKTEEGDVVQSILDANDEGLDVLIPGEIVDWTTACYVRDAAQLGMNKVILCLGHFNREELGMRHAVGWVSELVGGEIPVAYIPNNDMYEYVF